MLEKLWKKVFILGAAVLLTICFFEPIMGNQLVNKNDIIINTNNNHNNQIEESDTQSFNYILYDFKNCTDLKEINKFLKLFQDLIFKDYINEIFKKSISEIKEMVKLQIKQMKINPEISLSREEINKQYDILFHWMEKCGVKDEMSFSEALSLLLSNNDLKNNNGHNDGDSYFHQISLVWGLGYGFGSSSPCETFIPEMSMCIGFPLVYYGWWMFVEEFPPPINEMIPFKPVVNSYEVSSGELKYLEGKQSGQLTFLLGYFMRAGATPIQPGYISFGGLALSISGESIGPEHCNDSGLEKLNEDAEIKNNENGLLSLISGNYNKNRMETNYLKSFAFLKKLLIPTACKNSYTPHDPIHIIGNNDFKKPTEENGVVRGSGTINDPYVIENWEIKADLTPGIHIENTNVHFVVKNCYVYHGQVNHKPGILFNGVTNGEIIDCNVSNNDDGVHLRNSSFIKITNCKLIRNAGNIFLYNANNCEISNCISEKTANGILIAYGSSNNEVINCVFKNNFFGVSFFFSALNNHVINCNISNNFICGVFSLLSSDDKVNYNNIYDNEWFGMVAAGSIEDATYNWWDSADGPGGKGPGNGEIIGWIDGNIIYSPWLEEPI
jgi:parallel beta-helix repeat protein